MEALNLKEVSSLNIYSSSVLSLLTIDRRSVESYPPEVGISLGRRTRAVQFASRADLILCSSQSNVSLSGSGYSLPLPAIISAFYSRSDSRGLEQYFKRQISKFHSQELSPKNHLINLISITL